MQISLHNISQDSDDALRLVSAVSDLYQVTKRFVGKSIANLLSILALPLTLVLLELVVFILCRKVRRINLGINNYKDYVRIRKAFDKVSLNMESIDKISNTDLENQATGWLHKWLIKRVTKPFLMHQSNLSAALKKLDEPWIGTYKGFRQISEAEAWETRNKNHEYLI
ncbi:MAG: hypothetical protein AAGI49_05510 [Bacteroidota bacterium]